MQKKLKKILVTGGAGYVGSHSAKYLRKRGYRLIIVDDLSTGNKKAVKEKISKISILDFDNLRKVFLKHNFDSVFHFAAKSIVSESYENPNKYYENNISGTINILRCMHEFKVKKLIFSSSAAVFGNTNNEKIDEKFRKEPINPYGKTKLIVENILENAMDDFDISSVSLRYFNAAGASMDGEIGESRKQETHLIPKVIIHTLGDKNLTFELFGKNYPTPDGTCIRDYIHVDDLANAHYLSLKYLNKKKGNFFFNLGSGKGYSNLEIIKNIEKHLNIPIKYKFSKMRKGDPAFLISNYNNAKKALGWIPEYSDLDNIIKTACKWHQNKNF
jgi:UDP-glucose 4-epimerase